MKVSSEIVRPLTTSGNKKDGAFVPSGSMVDSVRDMEPSIDRVAGNDGGQNLEEEARAAMQKAQFDPGLTQQYNGALKRAINPDGRFNVRRSGATWHDAHPYLFLIHTSWPTFLAVVAATYVVVNTFFALIYSAIGTEHIRGAEAPTAALRFMNTFFFSAQTLTTVGYGNMSPMGLITNVVSSMEALTGLMAFAIATGLLFGRFSRPSARLGFSPRMLVAPYQEGSALEFRVVNRRSNNLINLEARVLMMTVEICDGKPTRRYAGLELERTTVLFLPLTWTVVHPIDAKSPLYRRSAADLAEMQAEFIVLIEAFDESFGQTVHARYSYRFDEIVWGAKFVQPFEVEESGDMLLEIDRVGDYQAVE